jgi:hypothetical protein
MTSVLQLFQIRKEEQEMIKENNRTEKSKVYSEKYNQKTELQEFSPRTMKRNLSNENFIKYQWAWVL